MLILSFKNQKICEEREGYLFKLLSYLLKPAIKVDIIMIKSFSRFETF